MVIKKWIKNKWFRRTLFLSVVPAMPVPLLPIPILVSVMAHLLALCFRPEANKEEKEGKKKGPGELFLTKISFRAKTFYAEFGIIYF
jgi:hypothetical protein